MRININVLSYNNICTVVKTYDGDTPLSERTHIIQNALIFLSNPDMLHVNMLPRHTQFVRLFSTLAFVVIDEAHTYTGVFGSHVAAILRRFVCVCVCVCVCVWWISYYIIKTYTHTHAHAHAHTHIRIHTHTHTRTHTHTHTQLTPRMCVIQ